MSDPSSPLQLLIKHVEMTADNAAVLTEEQADWPIQDGETSCSKTVGQEDEEPDWTNLYARVEFDADELGYTLQIDDYTTGTLQCSDSRSDLTGPWAMKPVGIDTCVVVNSTPDVADNSVTINDYTIGEDSNASNNLAFNLSFSISAGTKVTHLRGKIKSISGVTYIGLFAKNGTAITCVAATGEIYPTETGWYEHKLDEPFIVPSDGNTYHLAAWTSDDAVFEGTGLFGGYVCAFPEVGWSGTWTDSSWVVEPLIGYKTAEFSYTFDLSGLGIASVESVYKLPACYVGTGGEVSVPQEGTELGVVYNYPIGNDDGDLNNSFALGNMTVGQLFTVPDTTSIVGARFELNDYAAIAGTVTVQLKADDGSNAPTGSVLASVDNVSLAVGWNAVRFDSPFTPTASTKYWLLLVGTTGTTGHLNAEIVAGEYVWDTSAAFADYSLNYGIEQFNATELKVTHPDSGLISVGTDLVLNGSQSVEVTAVSESGASPTTYTCTINPAATTAVTSAAIAGTPLKVKELIVPETELEIVSKNGTALQVRYPTALAGLNIMDQHNTVLINGTIATEVTDGGDEESVESQSGVNPRNLDSSCSGPYTYVDLETILTNGVDISEVGVKSNTAATYQMCIVMDNGSYNYTTVAGSFMLEHSGSGGIEYAELATVYAVPTTGDFYVALYITGSQGIVHIVNSGTPAAYISGNTATVGQSGTYTAWTNAVLCGWKTAAKKQTILTLATDPGSVTSAVVPSRFPVSAETVSSVVRSDLTVGEETHDKLTVDHQIRSLDLPARGTAVLVRHQTGEHEKTFNTTVNLFTGAE